MPARRLRRPLSLAAVALSVASVSLISGAGASPAGPARAERVASSQVSAVRLPDNGTASILGTGLAASLRISRARLNIALPPVQSFIYLGAKSRPPVKGSLSLFPVPDGLLPANLKNGCEYYAALFPIDVFVVDVDEAEHRFRSLGAFVPVRVSALAFGSIPITATLSITQLVHDGQVVPIRLDGINQAVSLHRGQPLGAESAGCDPSWEHDVPPLYIADGEVNARLSDVTVDGRTVDVGNTCQTQTPAKLHLIGETAANGGNYNGALEGGELVQTRNPTRTSTPSRVALWPKSDNLTIPPFVGCRGARGEDVSRLVSSLVSGPGSTVSVNQSVPVFSLSSLDKPTACDPTGACISAPPNLAPPIPGR